MPRLTFKKLEPNVHAAAKILHSILSWGLHAKVLSPQELTNRLRAIHKMQLLE